VGFVLTFADAPALDRGPVVARSAPDG